MVQSIVSERLKRSMTGRLTIFDAQAASGSRMNSCLQPNEPPIGDLITRTRLIGIPSSVATRERAPKVDWVAV